MQEIIIDYFADCEEGGVIPTVTGLCLALNLTRQGLINYEVRPDFLDTVKRAKLQVEAGIEQRLLGDKQAAGAIFNLKNNFGWKDQSEHLMDHRVTHVERTIVDPEHTDR